jgi:hypothetical protein
MSNTNNKSVSAKHSFFNNVLKFLGWWFGFSGLYAMFSVCPFCGQTGCPVGAGTAGVFGGFFASIMKGRAFYSALQSKIKRKKLSTKINNHPVSKGKKEDATV